MPIEQIDLDELISSFDETIYLCEDRTPVEQYEIYPESPKPNKRRKRTYYYMLDEPMRD